MDRLALSHSTVPYEPEPLGSLQENKHSNDKQSINRQRESKSKTEAQLTGVVDPDNSFPNVIKHVPNKL